MKKLLFFIIIIFLLYSCGGEDENYIPCYTSDTSACNIDEYCNTDENQKDESGNITGYCAKAEYCFEDNDCSSLKFACTSQGYCKPGERTLNDNDESPDTDTTQNEDKTPPSVISKSPEGENKNFNTDGNITFTFSETVMISTVKTTLTDGNIETVLSCASSDKKTFTCPYSELKRGYTYTVIIAAGVRDNSIYENQMDSVIWTFKTKEPNSCETTPCIMSSPLIIPNSFPNGGSNTSSIPVAYFYDRLLFVNLKINITCGSNPSCAFDIYITSPSGNRSQIRSRDEEDSSGSILITKEVADFKDISTITGNWTLEIVQGAFQINSTENTLLNNWSIQFESY